MYCLVVFKTNHSHVMVHIKCTNQMIYTSLSEITPIFGHFWRGYGKEGAMRQMKRRRRKCLGI